jgi:hypothetical protein
MNFDYEMQLLAIQGSAVRNGPLTWAQQHMWPKVNLPENFRRMDLFIEVPVSSDMPEEVVISRLNEFVRRNTTLRTRILATDHGDAYQEISDFIKIPLHIVNIPDEPMFSSQIWPELPEIDEFHLVQILIVKYRQAIRLVGVRMNHVVTDKWGADLLREQLAKMFVTRDTGSAGATMTITDGAAAGSSLDLAAFESSTAGKRICARAVDYASTLLSSAPQTMFPHPRLEPEKPRYWDLSLWSAPCLAALMKVARERRVPISVPIISAFAAIMATRASLPAALIYIVCNNRVTRAWNSFTGPMVQDAPLCVPIFQSSLLEVIRSATNPIFKTYQNARHNPVSLKSNIAEINLIRGIRLDEAPYAAMMSVHTYNHPFSPTERTGQISYTDFFAAGAHPRKVNKTPRAEIEHLSFYIDAVIGPVGVTLAARVDTAVVSLAESEAIMRGVERLLCEVSHDDVWTKDIPDVCPGIGRPVEQLTEVVDGCLINISHCRDLLLSCPEVYDAVVQLDADNKELTTHVYTMNSDLKPSELHRRTVAKLRPHSLAIAPRFYRIFSPYSTPDPHERASARLVAEGDGRLPTGSP